MLAFMVAQFSVAVLYIDCFIQMTSFPVTKGFADIPVKTMLCSVVSVGKSFHTVRPGLTLFFPLSLPVVSWKHVYRSRQRCVYVYVYVCVGCWRVEGVFHSWNNLKG